MITFKQFLMEDEQDLVEFLKKNCAEALKVYAEAGRGLWRGMSNVDGGKYTFNGKSFEGAIVTPRKDREPLNTPRWAHNIANEYFKKKFGAPLRSTAVFCAAEQSSTSQYGESCVIFPIGNFEIVWSEKVPDLTLELFPDYEENGGDMVAGGDDAWPRKVPTGEEQKEWIRDFMEKSGYESDDPVHAIKTKPPYEKMLVCDKYFAVSMKASAFKDLVNFRELIKAAT